MKQLAVEWLQREVNTFLTNEQKKILKDVWEQAEAMEKKQKGYTKTAVESLIDEFNEELQVAIAIGNGDKIRTIKHLLNITSGYLEMEKAQIMNAFDECGMWQDNYSDSEHYYNKTFKSE